MLFQHFHGDLQPPWQGRLGWVSWMSIDGIAQVDSNCLRPRSRCPWRGSDCLDELALPAIFHGTSRDGTGLNHFTVRESHDVSVRVSPISEENARKEPWTHVAFCIMLSSLQRLFPKDMLSIPDQALTESSSAHSRPCRQSILASDAGVQQKRRVL